MKPLAVALGVVILLNLVGVLGFVGWLDASGRLDGRRVHQVVTIFKPTIAAEKAAQAKAAASANEKKQDAEEAARLASVANGPTTVADRLAQNQQANAIAMERLNRLKVEVSDLRDQIERAKQHLTNEQDKLDAKRKEFADYVAAHQKKIQDKQFQKAVQMLENLQPQQAKQMFQQMIQEKQTDQVVDYLQAMQVRKAAKVLQQFQTPAEIGQATMLLQKLRQRGSDPLATPQAAGVSPSAGNGGQT